jgi:hypothetical protein
MSQAPTPERMIGVAPDMGWQPVQKLKAYPIQNRGHALFPSAEVNAAFIMLEVAASAPET